MFGESETLAIDMERVSHQYKLCEETSFPVAFTNSVAQIAQRDHDIVQTIPLACGEKTAIDAAIKPVWNPESTWNMHSKKPVVMSTSVSYMHNGAYPGLENRRWDAVM